MAIADRISSLRWIHFVQTRGSLGLMAHHKRKRPKHRRSGCLLCKPHKLTANVKAERRKTTRTWASHERAAWSEAS